jgi:hypothetical protein
MRCPAAHPNYGFWFMWFVDQIDRCEETAAATLFAGTRFALLNRTTAAQLSTLAHSPRHDVGGARAVPRRRPAAAAHGPLHRRVRHGRHLHLPSRPQGSHPRLPHLNLRGASGIAPRPRPDAGVAAAAARVRYTLTARVFIFATVLGGGAAHVQGSQAGRNYRRWVCEIHTATVFHQILGGVNRCES